MKHWTFLSLLNDGKEVGFGFLPEKRKEIKRLGLGLGTGPL